LLEKVTDVVLIVIVATPDVPSANIPISSIPVVEPTKVTDLPVAAEVVPTFPTSLLISNTDLFNIRDTILGDLNQFLYLLTFK
jgi:hypothetical protein